MMNQNKELRKQNLVPRLIWVSTLKNESIQESVKKLFIEQQVKVIITSASFEKPASGSSVEIQGINSNGYYDNKGTYIRTGEEIKNAINGLWAL